ncbi:MAG TPA: patatin-like phospholipase family protein [Solirubrobacterales bacterium]|nr:patatin-like phospholipase family protein [Solirubrobacterales bacterium]
MKQGLLLTPGAARAAYQVGAVEVLVKEGGLRFDVIAASSVGALNGGFVATGQVERLAELWGGWKTRDILGPDWGTLLRGAVLWAPNLMHNRPQKENVIYPHLQESRLLPGVRFRFNLANLTGGRQEVFEWPGAPISLAEGVNASVAVPAAIRPAELLGSQYADGLTIDGFAAEALILGTGIERLFIVGVAPRSPETSRLRSAYGVMLRAMEINQYSETHLGIRRAREANALIRAWEEDRRQIEEAFSAVPDVKKREALLTEAADIYAGSGFPYSRPAVELITILPQRSTPMFFTNYQPRRSRALLDEGRRDARLVLAELEKESSRTEAGD